MPRRGYVPFQHSDLFKTRNITVTKEYDHQCQSCHKEFRDRSHNTKRCVECRKK
jgi:rRNA maturation endonuclease Nob1